MDAFIGRQQELESLHGLRQKMSSSLVVIWGRRRIGKSRLIEEFVKREKIRSFAFTGLPPEGKVTAQDQRDEFSRQMAMQGLTSMEATDWGDLFCHLAKQVTEGAVLILLDEISWMGSKDLLFLGKLKISWDLIFKKNPQLIMVLCGSISTWIEKNIINSTGFFGRISLYLRLDELPLYRCNEFWGRRAEMVSPYEKFKLLAVTGGVPRYLEEVNTALSSNENIYNLCFKPEGVLVHEFDRIFHDLFARRGVIYKQIAQAVRAGNLDQSTLLAKLSLDKGGAISGYLKDLEKAGFLSRDFTWDLHNGKLSKASKYRLKDNYLRFYLQWIEPLKERILRGQYNGKSLGQLPGWHAIMGLQFENLVLQNGHKIQEILKIDPNDVLHCGPFFQNQTNLRKGCQIDYLVQTTFGLLYVCEVKFSKHPITLEVVEEVREKISRIQTPKHMSFFPVLIHVNGITPAVEDAAFFTRIIDFGQLLKP